VPQRRQEEAHRVDLDHLVVVAPRQPYRQGHLAVAVIVVQAPRELRAVDCEAAVITVLLDRRLRQGQAYLRQSAAGFPPSLTQNRLVRRRHT
jgi:hypothetical protein